jgi:hypothetical protein
MPKHKLIGLTLQEAGLLSHFQVQTALKEQEYFSQLRIGEIFVLHSWLKQDTVNFFIKIWPRLSEEKNKKPLGYYLKQAGLLTQQQIEYILFRQKFLQMKFGSVAVLKGWLKNETIDFFLKDLAPENLDNCRFIPYDFYCKRILLFNHEIETITEPLNHTKNNYIAND